MEERQKIKIDRPVLVIHRERLERARAAAHDVHMREREKRLREREPLCRVVIAIDDERLDAPLCECREEIAEKRHRIFLGHALVVDIARDDDGVDFALIHDGQHRIHQKIALVVRHAYLAHFLAEMKVCQMKKLHEYSPSM